MPYKNSEQQKKAQAKHYQDNKATYKERDRKRRTLMREWYAELKTNYKCIECGEDHPACLTFHHRDPNEKDCSIAHMMSCRRSKKAILEEIEKCDCLCSNCHLKLHWEDQSQYQKALRKKRCEVR